MKNRLLQEFYGEAGFDLEEMYGQLMNQIEMIRQYITDTSLLVHANLRRAGRFF